jgi:hypothetical protein
MVKVDESADASKSENAAGEDWMSWLKSATAAAKPESVENTETPITAVDPVLPVSNDEPALVVPAVLTDPATQPTSQPTSQPTTFVELPTTELPSTSDIPAEPASPADPSVPDNK